jgi:hypothetical protein
MKTQFNPLFLTFLILPFFAATQKLYYGDSPVNWENSLAVKVPSAVVGYSTNPVVILDEHTEFHFFSPTSEKLSRYIRYFVNDPSAGQITSMQLPESFDPAYDKLLMKRGRQAKIQIPFISDYKLRQLAVRKFSRGKWSDVAQTMTTQRVRWMRSYGDDAGQFMEDVERFFSFSGISAGDVVDVYYEAEFNSNYGSNLFYFNSSVPKLRSDYIFAYATFPEFLNYKLLLPVNVQTKDIRQEQRTEGDRAIIQYTISLNDLNAVNYPDHAFGGKKLPYVFADFTYYRILRNSFPNAGARVNDYGLFRPKNFEWIGFADTMSHPDRIYDKQTLAIRKFCSTLPPVKGPDSTSKAFFMALCDTLNAFRFITANQLYYNEANLQRVYSGEHLLKRRLIEHLMWKVYVDILNEKEVFYYVVNIQDRRLGEHSTMFRANYAYEMSLVAIPNKDSYIYFMPRYGGLKYHLNELPFYLEGSLGNLSPRNFEKSDTAKANKLFKFIRTHRGTFNENTRTENATVKISLDSGLARLNIKESLSGQFSTVLRHYYLDELTDSTVSAHYFRKCTDKPLGKDPKIRMSSRITEYPFRYSFNCSEKISLPYKNKLDIRGWFSFPLSKSQFTDEPTHDYYFDFDLTDSYNFQLVFDRPADITNIGLFAKDISNEYFDLQSSVTNNGENSWLLKVQFSVKQTSILKKDMHLLMEIISELDHLNAFSLDLK